MRLPYVPHRAPALSSLRPRLGAAAPSRPSRRSIVSTVPVAVALVTLAPACGHQSHAASAADAHWRRPTAHERTTIARDIGWAWRRTDAFAADRQRGLHPVVGEVRLSRTDRHFASAAVHPLNRGGKQVAETATVALMQATGRWLIVIGPMTDFAVVCQTPAPRPILDLFC